MHFRIYYVINFFSSVFGSPIQNSREFCIRTVYYDVGKGLHARSLVGGWIRKVGYLLKSNFSGFERQSFAFVESVGRVQSCAWVLACVRGPDGIQHKPEHFSCTKTPRKTFSRILFSTFHVP